MRKLLLAFILVTASFAEEKGLSPALGMPTAFGGSIAASTGIDDTHWTALAVRPRAVGTGLTSYTVHYYVASVTGGPIAAAEATCELWTDAAGVPSAILADSSAGQADAEFNAAGWRYCTATIGATKPSVLTFYWIVLKGVTAKSYTVRYLNNGGQYAGWSKKETADSGTAWATSVSTNALGWRVSYTDGSTTWNDGFAFTNSALTVCDAYDDNQCGVVFTVPSNVNLKVCGLSLFLYKSGSPPNPVTLKLYSGAAGSPTLIDTTAGVPAGMIPTSGFQLGDFFATCRDLTAGVHRIVAATVDGDGSNRYIVTGVTIQNDATNRTLPVWGTNKTSSTNGGTSFTDATAGPVASWLLIPSHETPQNACAGGGGAGCAYIY